ncbi:hypothetical protein ACFXI0_24330 [Kitasatospora indigofera]|uniref:hypothetical protein n=1 Tax=Kitasatospora indigofera TaxID=67307 RepID=UPI00368EB204
MPELGPYGREAALLHPERGTPGVRDSSIGGPLLWPADEPWPTCSVPDGESSSGAPASPMVPVVQLFAADVPGPWWPDGSDVLQILWCPNEHWDAPPHQADVSPVVMLRRRSSADVGAVIENPPAPLRHEEFGYLPQPCVIKPEHLVDFPFREELPHTLRVGLQQLVDGTGPEGQDVITRVAGWKLGGWPTWHLAEPWAFKCEVCASEMRLLFTIASDHATDVVVGRWGDLRIFSCVADHRHPFEVDLH